MAYQENRLREILAIILPTSVFFEVKCFDKTISDPDLDTIKIKYPISKAEYQDVQKTIPYREIEYRIGRFLAKKILGIERQDTTTSLYKKQNGSVNWPRDVIGSISHSAASCVVVVTKSNNYAGIGIDIEYGSFDTNIEVLIASRNELTFNVRSLTYIATLRLIFCCKEAIYKSLEAFLKKRIDFLDVAIQFIKPTSPNIYEFGFQFCKDIPELEEFSAEHFNGIVYADEEMALSLVTLKHNSLP